MAKHYDTPIKAIRKKCLDCTCYQPKEIRLSPVVECALYPYRFGRRPTQAIVDTIKKYYEKKVEPAQELLPKKGTIR